MERLTKKHERGYYMTIGPTERGNYDAIQRLGELEDVEEQGLLIRLPCKVGQELFWNIQRYNEEKNIVEYVVEKLKVIGYGGNELNPVVITAENSKKVAFRFSVSAFGKRVFLSHEEAEAALAEKEGENG